MFYSQTFLARKGPLGTVWCAAHLQHRLKKSHYTSTNIPSTVDRIMFPEVPLALRMSGHLLLGVVRIYSKKVDYLYHDCNVILISLRKAFASVDVNLPEDATHAPVHTITLPEKFDLDALVLDDLIYDEGYDNHRSSQEDITLTDQNPPWREIYVAISFDEDIMMDCAPPEEVPDSGVGQMEDILRASPIDADVGFHDPGPSNQTEVFNATLDIQDPASSNQTEVFNATMDVQDPASINQKEPPTETVDKQDPGAGNQKELTTETVDTQDPGASNQKLPTETAEIEVPGASNQTDILSGTMNFQERGPSNQIKVLNPRLTDSTSPENFPEIEVMRDAAHDFSPGNLPPLFSDRGNDTTEPTGSLDQILNEKEIHSPILEDILDSGGQSLQFQQRSEPPASAFSQEVPELFDTHVSFGHSSPALAVRSTPLVQQQKPRARKRNILDKNIVLPNKIMKKALEESSDLLRKKRSMPSSALGLWKLNNSVRKEQVFHEPLLTGLSIDICHMFKDHISTKPHLVAVEEDIPEPMVTDSVAPEIEAIKQPVIADSPAPAAEAVPDPRVVQSPSHTIENIAEPSNAESSNHKAEALWEPGAANSSIPVSEIDMEIERLRCEESNVGNDNLPEFMPSPARVVPSSLRRDDLTPFSTNSLGSESVPQTGTTFGSPVLPSPDVAASTGTHGSELETPRTILEERLGLDHTGLSDIPELINSAEAEMCRAINSLKPRVQPALTCEACAARVVALKEAQENILELMDLSFLEADNNTPTGSQASQGVDSLSVRTRAVAQYLKQHSPITPLSEEPSGHLSLKKILAGKTRKLCARMFFETLVLKTYDLIDVQQEEPYGDITLKLTPTLSKVQI